MKWSLDNAVDQSGKTFVVTGANSGIGYEVSKMLAMKHGQVVLACRNAKKGEDAAVRIRRVVPDAKLTVLVLDVSSLESVRAFAAALLAKFTSVDGLINNAGVMALPYAKSVDGYELQFATNHLGPFALTALLLPALEKAEAARVVAVSSTMHRFGGSLRLDDLQSEKAYRKWPAYGASKLANLLFTFELERRLRAAGKKTIAVACHPGYSSTNLLHVGTQASKSTLFELVFKAANSVVAQSAHDGALPTLFAATEPSITGGDYVGPSGPFELFGSPTLVGSSKKSRDESLARELFAASEQLTQIPFGLT